MAERIRRDNNTTPFPRSRTFGGAAVGARQQFAWLWSRESILRLALSLVLATALWLYVTQQQNPDVIDFGPPIAVSTTNLGIQYTVTNSLGAVHVRYRASNPNLYVAPTSFRASVNLVAMGPGTYRHVPIQVLTDPGINVIKVTPSTVAVVIERTISKHVRIVPHYLVRNTPAGYDAGQPIIQPNTITVSGPESLVSQVNRATIDLDLSGVRASILALYKPTPVDSQGVTVAAGSHLSITPSEVQVQVPIHTVTSYKTLPVLVPIVGHPRDGFGVGGVTVQPSTVTATGSPNALNRVSTLSTAPIPVSGHGGGRFRTSVPVHLPAGVSSHTHRVTVTVQLNAVDASSATEIAVTPQNVVPGLAAHIRPGYVLITVVGQSSALRAAAHKLTAVVDLANFGTGIYTVTPVISAPKGLVVGDVYPRQVQATVQVSQ